MSDINIIPLPRLAAKLMEITGHPGPSYMALYRRVCDGTLPSIYEFGRHYVRESDLPQIIETLCLSVPGAPAPPVRSWRTKEKEARSRKAIPDLFPAA